jgi:hypothetical protein
MEDEGLFTTKPRATTDGNKLIWPATAPEQDQTVVVLGPGPQQAN